MRLFYLNSARGWAGAENWSFELCTGLADRGHDITVACHPKGSLDERLRGDGRLSTVPIRIGGDFDPLRIARLASILLNARPNLVIAYRTKDIKLAVPACWLAGRLPLVHAHKAPGPLKNSPHYRFLWTRGVRALAVPSNVMRTLLLQESRWLEKKPITVIPNGVDSVRYRPRPELRGQLRRELRIPEDAFVVSYHGKTEYRKNLDLLIRGVAAANTRLRVHALIIGDGPRTDELQQLASALEIPTTFAGFRTDIPDILSAADAAAHLSTAEGMPNSVLEAMACALPVIASNATSHAEQITDGEHGYLVRPGDVESVAEAILKLASAPEDLARMGRAAQKRAVEDFSRDTMIERYEHFFAQHASPGIETASSPSQG